VSALAKVWLASVALLVASTGVAADKDVKPVRPPSSYAPRPGGSHVYGSPIQAPVVGQSTARRNYAHKKSVPGASGARAHPPAKAHSKPKVARHTANE